MRIKRELNKLQSALEDVFLHGEISHGDKLDRILMKNDISFTEPFGFVDLIVEFCKKHNITSSFNKRGKLVLKREQKNDRN